MEREKIITAFSRLGNFLGGVAGNSAVENGLEGQAGRFNSLIPACFHHNGWFTEENVRYALGAWSASLNKKDLENWLNNYPERSVLRQKTIAVIMAGNIPVVGFHDMICVLVSGNKFLGKLSASDKILLPAVAEALCTLDPGFREMISFTEERLSGMDAVIATGSDNTSRYFEHYFSKYPNIIRKNRSSLAILNGMEKQNELEALGEDIFRYFGLGCRNVSKLFVPKGYDINLLFNALFKYKNVLQNNKYANNYEYNRTIYLMQKLEIIDNNFLLLRKEIGLHAPVAVLFYEEYENEMELGTRLKMDHRAIQCIVSAGGSWPGSISFGKTQQPALWDYADDLDTMEFLIGLK